MRTGIAGVFGVNGMARRALVCAGLALAGSLCASPAFAQGDLGVLPLPMPIESEDSGVAEIQAPEVKAPPMGEDDPLMWDEAAGGGEAPAAPEDVAAAPPSGEDAPPADPLAMPPVEDEVAVTTEEDPLAPPAEDVAQEEGEGAPLKDDALEARVAKIEEALGGFATKDDIEALKKEIKSLQASPRAAAPKKESAPPAKSAGKAPAVKKSAPARDSAPKEWVLKSAKPGMAWVSEAGSRELRAVSVGETLPGIGKITSIDTDAGGRWVVSGSRGEIRQ